MHCLPGCAWCYPCTWGRARGTTDDSSYAVRSTQKISKTLLINYNPLMKNYIFKRHQPCIATSDIENPDDAPDRGYRKCVITRETRVGWTKPYIEPVGWHTHRYRSHTHTHSSLQLFNHTLPAQKQTSNQQQDCAYNYHTRQHHWVKSKIIKPQWKRQIVEIRWYIPAHRMSRQRNADQASSRGDAERGDRGRGATRRPEGPSKDLGKTWNTWHMDLTSDN